MICAMGEYGHEEDQRQPARELTPHRRGRPLERVRDLGRRVPVREVQPQHRAVGLGQGRDRGVDRGVELAVRGAPGGVLVRRML